MQDGIWQVRGILLFEYKRGLLVERILKERKNSCLEDDNKILTINKLYIRSIYKYVLNKSMCKYMHTHIQDKVELAKPVLVLSPN